MKLRVSEEGLHRRLLVGSLLQGKVANEHHGFADSALTSSLVKPISMHLSKKVALLSIADDMIVQDYTRPLTLDIKLATEQSGMFIHSAPLG